MASSRSSGSWAPTSPGAALFRRARRLLDYLMLLELKVLGFGLGGTASHIARTRGRSCSQPCSRAVCMPIRGCDFGSAGKSGEKNSESREAHGRAPAALHGIVCDDSTLIIRNGALYSGVASVVPVDLKARALIGSPPFGRNGLGPRGFEPTGTAGVHGCAGVVNQLSTCWVVRTHRVGIAPGVRTTVCIDELGEL